MDNRPEQMLFNMEKYTYICIYIHIYIYIYDTLQYLLLFCIGKIILRFSPCWNGCHQKNKNKKNNMQEKETLIQYIWEVNESSQFETHYEGFSEN